jgi:hypothetical protein
VEGAAVMNYRVGDRVILRGDDPFHGTVTNIIAMFPPRFRQILVVKWDSGFTERISASEVRLERGEKWGHLGEGR